MKRGMVFVLVFVLTAVWGCASSPPEKPDSDRIKQDADRGFGSLDQEEEEHGNEGYPERD